MGTVLTLYCVYTQLPILKKLFYGNFCSNLKMKNVRAFDKKSDYLHK